MSSKHTNKSKKKVWYNALQRVEETSNAYNGKRYYLYNHGEEIWIDENYIMPDQEQFYQEQLF